MAIYKALFEAGTSHTPGSATGCAFNGELKDYLGVEGHPYQQFDQLFKDLAELNEKMRICVKLPLEINHKVIANQIIRYKDAFKLPERYVKVPFIFYWQQEDGSDRAILISLTDYIEAKGLYFCLTEPQNEYEGSRNEVLAAYLSNDNSIDIINAYRDIACGKRTIGSVQRHFDSRYLESVDEMKEKCIALAQQLFDDAISQLKQLEVDKRSELIYQTVSRCFLIKKAMYVQYMMSKEILNSRHEGDSRKQRQFAKAYADEVPIISYSELWRVSPDEDVHAREYETRQPKKEAETETVTESEAVESQQAEETSEATKEDQTTE